MEEERKPASTLRLLLVSAALAVLGIVLLGLPGALLMAPVVPLAYANSGLEDTIVDVQQDPRRGTGFVFPSYNGDSLLEGFDAARKLYKDGAAWRALVLRCLRQDFSWQATARSYLKAYRRVTRRVRAKRAVT